MIIAQKAGKARVEMEVGGQGSEDRGQRLEIAVNRQNMLLAVGRNARRSTYFSALAWNWACLSKDQSSEAIH